MGEDGKEDVEFADEEDIVPANGDMEVVKGAVLANMAPSTRSSFDRYSQSFLVFCNQSAVEPNGDALLKWAIFLRAGARRLAVSSIWTAISLVRKFLRFWMDVHVSSDSHEWKVIKDYLKAEGRHSHAKQSSIVPKDLLMNYFKNGRQDGEMMVRKLAAGFQYFGGLRREEVAHLTFAHVRRKSYGVEFDVVGSKTDPAGTGATFLIPLKGGCGLVELFDQYCQLVPRPTKDDRLFVRYDRGHFTPMPVGKNTIADYTKLMADEAGLTGDQLKQFTSHGVRATTATVLADAGMSLENLMRAGRWRSASVAQRYMRESVVQRQEMARMLGDAPNENEEKAPSHDGEANLTSIVSKCAPAGPESAFSNCTFQNCMFSVGPRGMAPFVSECWSGCESRSLLSAAPEAASVTKSESGEVEPELTDSDAVTLSAVTVEVESAKREREESGGEEQGAEEDLGRGKRKRVQKEPFSQPA